MASLGSFDVAVKAADPNRELDTFTLCGEVFTVAAEVSPVPLALFAKAAKSGLDSSEMDGMAALIDVVAQCVVDEDIDRFLAVATKKRVDMDLLMKIVAAVIEAQSGRPTKPLSDSSDGRSTTGENSTAPSPSAASPRPNWRDTPFGRRELAAHPEEYEGIGSMAENGLRLMQETAG